MATDVLTAQGLSVGAPTADDADAVADLYNACSMDEIGVPTVTTGEVRQWWSITGFDPRTDAFVVRTPAREIIGYAEAWPLAPHDHVYTDVRVHPGHTGRGIGTHLLRLVEARAREIAARAPAGTRTVVATGINSTHEPSRRLLERHGYALTRHFWQMGIALDAEPAAPRWPDGLVVRTAVAGQDERAVWEADEEAFLDHFDHHQFPFEDWLKFVAAPERYDPTLWFLALDGDRIAGVALCEAARPEDPECGWVSTLGVRRPWRRRGLGLALLQHSFGEFYRRGRRRAGLNVDASSLTGATRLYERAGMRVVRQRDRYEKALRAGATEL
jgi:mycothiol synthase